MKEENPIVLVTWQDPKFSHGVIEGYLVAFGVKGESHVEERRFNGNIHRFITPFLGKLHFVENQQLIDKFCKLQITNIPYIKHCILLINVRMFDIIMLFN